MMDRFQPKTRTEELSTGGYEEIRNLHSNFSLQKQKKHSRPLKEIAVTVP